jgi:uncharacterized membrane protein
MEIGDPMNIIIAGFFCGAAVLLLIGAIFSLLEKSSTICKLGVSMIVLILIGATYIYFVFVATQIETIAINNASFHTEDISGNKWTRIMVVLSHPLIFRNGRFAT